MWVYEELIEGRKLTEIINEDHENVKYLPGVKLPENVVAVPELLDAARDADLFVFVIPHQFISRLVGQMKGNIKSTAAAISLIKGINITGKSFVCVTVIFAVSETANFPWRVRNSRLKLRLHTAHLPDF